VAHARYRTGRKITHEAYAALGGVAGALSTYADQLYGSLARKDQEVVRDLFARLVASDGTRNPRTDAASSRSCRARPACSRT